MAMDCILIIQCSCICLRMTNSDGNAGWKEEIICNFHNFQIFEGKHSLKAKLNWGFKWQGRN